MKRFRFRLQKVMETREEVERQREQALARARKQVVEEEERLERLVDEDRICLRKIEEKKRDIINPVEMQHYYSYLQKIQSDIENQNGRVGDVKRAMEERRRDLIDASKEKQILKKLKERRYSSYREEVSRKERQMMDEIASVQHGRGKEQGSWL